MDGACGAVDLLVGADQVCTTAGRNVLGAALRLQQQASAAASPLPKPEDLRNRNYASLHDEFLEALLLEQTHQTRGELEASGAADDTIAEEEEDEEEYGGVDEDGDEEDEEGRREQRPPVSSVTIVDKSHHHRAPHNQLQQQNQNLANSRNLMSFPGVPPRRARSFTSVTTTGSTASSTHTEPPPQSSMTQPSSPRKRPRRSIRLHRRNTSPSSGRSCGTTSGGSMSSSHNSNNPRRRFAQYRRRGASVAPLDRRSSSAMSSVASSTASTTLLSSPLDYSNDSSCQLRRRSGSSSGISERVLPDPGTYVHVQCRMQKDKGKGEPIGSNICAKGRDACLEKLRAKMRLLTDVVMNPDKGPATMKRRKARVAEDLDNFIETRSLIELKMGFLSITYGVLLRWDTGRTGSVTLVVLRKMCHTESFYPSSSHHHAHSKHGNHSHHHKSKFIRTMMPSFPHHSNHQHHVSDVSVDTRHAIFQRQDGMEVTLLDPPYRVERPETFEPSTLSARVLFATGLAKRSNWTVKLAYEGQSENVLLTWDSDEQCFVPKLGDPLHLELNSLSLTPLEIKLYEHRLRRRSYRRLITTMNVPLANLEPQQSSSSANKSKKKKIGSRSQQSERSSDVRLMIPCKHDEDASIALELVLESDYGHWVNQELELRRREEVTAAAVSSSGGTCRTGAAASGMFGWTAAVPYGSYFAGTPGSGGELVPEDESGDLWDWIFCSVC